MPPVGHCAASYASRRDACGAQAKPGVPGCPPGHPTLTADQRGQNEADGAGDQQGGQWAFGHGIAKIGAGFVELIGHGAPYAVRLIVHCIFYLAIGALRRTDDLVGRTLRLQLGVTSQIASGALDIAANILRRALETVFVHGYFLRVMQLDCKQNIGLRVPRQREFGVVHPQVADTGFWPHVSRHGHDREDDVIDATTPLPTAPPLPIDDAGRTELILDVVAKETGVARERLLRNASLAALEIPSLDMVQTVFELESRFAIEIPVVVNKSGAEFETVGDLVDHVLTAIGQQRRI
jgi:acyl carrier protein